MILDWITPDISNFPQIEGFINQQSESGCDLDAVNIFLYQLKYSTKICIYKNWLLRKYKENDSIYYGFPVKIETETDSADFQEIIDLLKDDALQSNAELQIYFATDTQLELLKTLKHCSYTCEKNRDLADYLYLQKNLAELAGSKYSKKRGHINQFLKKHPDAKFLPLAKENFSEAIKVEQKWLSQMDAADSADLVTEQTLISNAIENFESLNLTGGIVICDEKPVAMCLASRTNQVCTDIHFEKAIMPYAKDGAYAFINQNFAKTITTEYINREEDLGFENLRKAKNSYYPDQLLEKSVIIFK